MPNVVGHVLGPDSSPTTALFTVDVEADGDEVCRLRARGELDAAAVATLTAALHDPARPHRRFVNLDALLWGAFVPGAAVRDRRVADVPALSTGGRRSRWRTA